MKTLTLSDEQRNSLEKLLDHTSLSGILEALSQIAYLKAEHISANWQDHQLARAWERAGNKLAVDAIKTVVTAVS
jgi:hypothetical protein